MHSSIRVYRIEPLTDPRWNILLDGHPCASVFHTRSWLNALQATYGYEPVAFTTTQPGAELQNAVLFCRVNSRLTGERLVSLPFSDHCDPLIEARSDLAPIISELEGELCKRKLRYVELRPRAPLDGIHPSLQPHASFRLHEIDLAPDIQTVLQNCHKASIQRKLCRARREGITYEEGRSGDFIDALYRLLIMTRRRHQVPPQPRRWFESLVHYFGEALKIRIACRGGQPIAAILTLRYKDTMMYKYGCSDAHLHRLGGMPLLLWRAIQDAHENSMQLFDLGRTDSDNAGLITFKSRWGARPADLAYFRIVAPPGRASFDSLGRGGWAVRKVRQALARLPDPVFRSAGAFLYRHIG